jgi:hypothetical protein
MFKRESFNIFIYIMKLRYEVWLPKLKFTLQTIALYYPKNPNEVTIRTYYNLIQNLPIFFPDEPMGAYMRKILDDFPVSPYLNSKTSFMKWIHFVFNKINKKLELNTESFYESLEEYYKHYKPKEILNKEQIKNKKKYMYGASVIVFLTIAIYYYNK